VKRAVSNAGVTGCAHRFFTDRSLQVNDLAAVD